MPTPETPLLAFWRLMNEANRAEGLPELDFAEAREALDEAKSAARKIGWAKIKRVAS